MGGLGAEPSGSSHTSVSQLFCRNDIHACGRCMPRVAVAIANLSFAPCRQTTLHSHVPWPGPVDLCAQLCSLA